MKLLRTIQLDPSDNFVFARTAEPGEWAVSGAFEFWDVQPDSLEGKARAEFRAGFLGLPSRGRSTLVQIVEATESEHADLVDLLARQLVDHYGAPDLDQARVAAADEVAFVASLCTHPADTLIAVHRRVEDGDIRESFRTLRPRNGPKPLRAFAFLEVEDDENEPADEVDLAALAREPKL